MAKLLVQGGRKLMGKVKPSGNKNSILPVLCATLLTKEKVILHNVPDIIGVQKIVEVLKKLGSDLEWNKKTETLVIENKNLHYDPAKTRLPLGERGAVLLIAPLLSRFKKLSLVSTIGGCTLGIRELDPHFEILKALGVDIKMEEGNINLSLGKTGGFIGGSYWFDYMSVTSTETFLMASVCASGKSVLMNAASEPHVQDLCHFLNKIGAKIDGTGGSRLEVQGVGGLTGGEFRITSDHQEIATYLALGAMTGGRIEVEDALPQHMPLVIRTFGKLGVEINYDGNTAVVEENGELRVRKGFTFNKLVKVEAAPWPYFPGDILPLMMALATKAKGEVLFWNKLYEGAFFWVPEMVKLGAKVVMCDPHRVIVWGGLPLKGTILNAPPIIRATVALYMMAVVAKGQTEINNAGSIIRAHPNFVEKMVSIGAELKWVE